MSDSESIIAPAPPIHRGQVVSSLDVRLAHTTAAVPDFLIPFVDLRALGEQQSSSPYLRLDFESCIARSLQQLTKRKLTVFSAQNLLRFLGLSDAVLALLLRESPAVCGNCGVLASDEQSAGLVGLLDSVESSSQKLLLVAYDPCALVGSVGSLSLAQLSQLLEVERIIYQQSQLRTEQFSESYPEIFNSSVKELAEERYKPLFVADSFSEGKSAASKARLEQLSAELKSLGIDSVEIFAAQHALEHLASRRLGPICQECGAELIALERSILNGADPRFLCEACHDGYNADCVNCCGTGLSKHLGSAGSEPIVLESIAASSISQLVDRIKASRSILEPRIAQMLKNLEQLIRFGLGYLRIAQPLAHLSSGERVKLKLALCESLALQDQILELDGILSIFGPDESSELHKVLQRIADAGNTVIAPRADTKREFIPRPDQQAAVSRREVITRFNPAAAFPTLFSHVDLEFTSSSLVGITGRSASGKSLLCSMLRDSINTLKSTQLHCYDQTDLIFSRQLRVGEQLLFWPALIDFVTALPAVRALGLARTHDPIAFCAGLSDKIVYKGIKVSQLPFLSFRELQQLFSELAIFSKQFELIAKLNLQHLSAAQRLVDISRAERAACLLAQAFIRFYARKYASKPHTLILDGFLGLVEEQQLVTLAQLSRSLADLGGIIVYTTHSPVLLERCDVVLRCERSTEDRNLISISRI